MTTTRRDFLVQSGACVVGASALSAAGPRLAFGVPNSAGGKASPTLVAVYLRGGADALGVIVPYADKDYAKLRPTLAVPGPESKDPNAALPLNNELAFNPSVKDLHMLWQKGMCVPIVCVGSPHPTRSHFDAQDFMERGAPGQKSVATGWLNRYLQETHTAKDANLRAVALQPLLPRSLRGNYPVLARPDQRSEQLLARYGPLYRTEAGTSATGGNEMNQNIRAYGTRTINQIRELNEMINQAPATTAKYPETPFGRQMRDVARMIKAQRGLEVAAIDYGGWDHHVDEGTTTGQMAKRLSDLGTVVSAFVDDLGPIMDRVLLLVMSEFGRTVKENGTKGTDHGHGGFMLAIGGRVHGKKVYGKWAGLSDSQLYEKRDLPVSTDFRVVFAESLKGLFGYDGIKEKLFPAYTPDSPPLGFLRTA